MITWTTAFLDFEAEEYDAGVAFWRAVTGYGISPTRGEHDEFATLLPGDGDAFLRVQRLGAGPSRVHLDLHAPTALVDRAVDLGATVVAQPGHTILRSPGGLVFCVVPPQESRRRPQPTAWAGHESLVDQVCLDIPPRMFERECLFWSDLTGWTLHSSAIRPEFHSLERPADIPLRLLLHRLDDGRDQVGAHFDIACTDVAEEVARHRALGSTTLAELPWWTHMQSPGGTSYCITSRNPTTGTL